MHSITSGIAAAQRNICSQIVMPGLGSYGVAKCLYI